MKYFFAENSWSQYGILLRKKVRNFSRFVYFTKLKKKEILKRKNNGKILIDFENFIKSSKQRRTDYLITDWSIFF